jgi:hypothetical protein
MSHSRAPFSFHCTICFESLNLSNRSPVVLPCGHTYICEMCAKRLDKCMECRAPLKNTIMSQQKQKQPPRSPGAPTRHFPSTPPPNGSIGLGSSFGNIRGGRRSPEDMPLSTESNPRRPQTGTVRLPMPRNHVLMCLIEAVQDGTSDKKDGYESGDDDELVLRGIQVMGSSSGTYVVKEMAGLKVHPANAPIYPNQQDEDNVMTLQYGQTVQIFLFENRIATVARGGGYILISNSSQLVKVSEVTDPACKLEASNKVLLAQIEEMENKVNSIKRTQQEVARKLDDTLADTENSSPFGPIPETLPNYSLDEEDGRPHKHAANIEMHSLPSKYIGNPKDNTLTESHSFDHPRLAPFTSIISCTSSFGDEAQPESQANAFRGRHERSQSQDNTWSFWQSIFGAPSDSSSSPSNTKHREQRTSDAPVGVGQMITDHVTPRHSTIDFSSGMSGHRGLNHAATPNSQGHRNVRMMSHHSGFRSYT